MAIRVGDWTLAMNDSVQLVAQWARFDEAAFTAAWRLERTLDQSSVPGVPAGRSDLVAAADWPRACVEISWIRRARSFDAPSTCVSAWGGERADKLHRPERSLLDRRIRALLPWPVAELDV